MNNLQFALFDSPLDLAFNFWEKLLSNSDTVIDATLGHGFDALKVLPLIPEGFLYGFDVQKEAIESTCLKLNPYYKNFELFHQSHETFPKKIKDQSVKLIIYNLGYLPKGNKNLTTLSSSTLLSLDEAIKKLLPSGVISIMCYPGHNEGAIEKEAVFNWARTLHKNEYLVTFHELINRDKAPALCLVQKKQKENSYA